jgi:hypothetical protein
VEIKMEGIDWKNPATLPLNPDDKARLNYLWKKHLAEDLSEAETREAKALIRASGKAANIGRKPSPDEERAQTDKKVAKILRDW